MDWEIPVQRNRSCSKRTVSDFLLQTLRRRAMINLTTLLYLHLNGSPRLTNETDIIEQSIVVREESLCRRRPNWLTNLLTIHAPCFRIRKRSKRREQSVLVICPYKRSIVFLAFLNPPAPLPSFVVAWFISSQTQIYGNKRKENATVEFGSRCLKMQAFELFYEQNIINLANSLISLIKNCSKSSSTELYSEL